MKKTFLLLLALLLMLTACGPAVDYPPATTTAPSSAPPATEPAAQPTVEPTTVPTEVTEPQLSAPWLIEGRQSPSYDDFFSQDLPYNTIPYEWLVETEQGSVVYALRSDWDSLYVSLNVWDADYRIPNTESLIELELAGTDGRWGYLLSDEGILQLDLLTGETSLLVENEHILQAELQGYDVLYYAAVTDGTIGIYRLYLPTMTLDTMLSGIEIDHGLGGFSFSAPDSTLGTITWSTLNPEMVTLVTAELNDPNSPYKSDGAGNSVRTDHLWDDQAWLQEPGAYRNHALWVCYWLQQDTGVHTWYKGTYDCAAGTLTEDTGVIDNCWFGSGYAHDHYEPEITELPDPVPTPGEWISIPGMTLPASPTADEMYAEGVYDHFDLDINPTIHGEPLQPQYLYTVTDYVLTKVLDIPVVLAANSMYYLYCVTEDGAILQVTHDGQICNTLYTAQEQIRSMDHANGHLYILDGDTLIDLDIPAMRYRVLLEQTDIIVMRAWDNPGEVYFCVARGLHYQQYIYHTDTGELEPTHFL